MDTATPPLRAAGPGSTQPIALADPSVRRPPECIRLRGQCAQILGLFERAPDHLVSNAELAAVSYKYTSRISDLRRSGHRITLVRRNRLTGHTVYQHQGIGGAK